MRILILGDSLGLPRPQNIKKYSPDKELLAVAYEETYASILSQKINFEIKDLPRVEIINRAIRFSTIKDIHKGFFDHLFYFQPDVIILQIGIVDCWYRENNDFKQLVDIVEFEIYLKSICQLLSYSSCKLIIIGICPSSQKMYDRYKGIEQEIKNYNQILKASTNNQSIFYVNMESYIDSDNPHVYLLPDDIHLNKLGNKLVAEECLKIIYQLNRNKEENLEKIDNSRAFLKIKNISREKYIFGAGQSGRKLKSIFENYGIKIAGFIDNAKEKNGEIIDNSPVYNLNDLKNFSNCPFFIVSSMYWRDIAKQLVEEGYQYEKDYLYHFYYNEDFSLIV